MKASDINATLSTFNTFLSFQPESSAVIDDAFDFILGVANHSNTRIVVLVGVSDAFVLAAETSCKKLTDVGYSIFTVSLGTADFSPLATNKSHVYQQGDPTSSVEATKIANEIGAALLSESSICFHSSLPTTAVAMTSLLSTGRTVTTSRTPSCVDTFIQQDIAFVVELSTSSGSLDASRAASNFVTQNLMQQAVFSDIYSNFAIVPFPNASLYTIGGGIQDFGSLQIADFPFAFQMMFSYYPFLNGVDSDIQSGLQYTKDFEFPRLQDNYPRTILLFANSAAGVQAATSIASELKSDGVTILTISVSDSDDVNLRSLGTSPTDSWNLPVSDTSSYPTTAKSIALSLLKFGSVCQSP